MAISTYKTFLMTSEDGLVWSKLVDIKEFPDLGGTPEMIETTTLSDPMQTFIEGIQTNEGLTFPANYTKDDYAKVKALKGQDKHYAVWFGGTESEGVATADGSQGKFKFKGMASVRVLGGGTNEAVGMEITIAPSTPITEDAGK